MAENAPVHTVVVATGGAPFDPAAVAHLPHNVTVVGGDGGTDHALAAGLRPDVLVGDLDSITPAGLDWATANITIERHRADKVATDTELALHHAAALRPRRVVLIAGRGDRVDHAIAAIGALGGDSLSGVPVVEGWWGADELLIARPESPVLVTAAAGTTFSLLALHGPCRGVTLTGARWPLDHADLPPMAGLGVSNEVAGPPCSLAVADGVVTVIIPGAQP
jgi:thiamine pyrophosphokinase